MPEQKNPDSSLKTRARSALLLAPLVLAVMYVGGLPFALMMAGAAGIGAYEWARMVLPDKIQLAKLSAALTALAAAGAGMLENPIASLAFLLALCFLLFAVNFSQGGPSIKTLLAGIIYIGFSIAVMTWLRGGRSDQGLYYLATLLAVVWASDISAYIAGKTIGGAKLAPKISPKKTWAGFIGSSVGAAIAAAGMACPALTHKLDVDTLHGMNWLGYAAMGAILAMFGQGGDLLVSAFKRHYKVKDTGTLIPGHGGLLDRIDALMLAAIVYGALVWVLA